MAMPVTLRRFTVDEVEAFPADGNRYELLDGVLFVSPGPGLPHQTVATRLAALLCGAVGGEPGIQVWAPGTLLVQPKTLLQPDLLVGRLPARLHWEALVERFLAVEVSGSGSRIYDREYKRNAYLALGVEEVWLLDLASRRVLVSRPGGPTDEPHDHELVWRTPGGREVWVDLDQLFAGLAPGEE